MKDLKESLKLAQERVNSYLENYFSASENVAPKLYEAMRYGVLLGGKRVRPFLVYNVAKMLNGDEELADMGASAIECIHAYSLIHDDLPAMDNDELRRGKPTVHVAFGEAQAILAGDGLQAMAFEILSKDLKNKDLIPNQLKMMNVLAKGSGHMGMCGGQELDLEAEGKLVSQKELECVHRHKTGALIESAALMGLLCTKNVSEEIKEKISTYARAIGLAFQVWDDVLDIISDTETLGKPQGSDEDENKSTYPRLMGLENAQNYAKKLANDAIEAIKDLPNNQILKDFATYIVSRDH
ncbi:MAG: farnesyl diphosphate synthase [Succinivibrionaceae bacterium]|nr:farnesyl diphosphate synthase [Succinivibrionaceae bacterium]